MYMVSVEFQNFNNIYGTGKVQNRTLPQENPVLQALAEQGLTIYFTGFLFVGFNYLTTSLLSATERAATAFALSFLRGCIGITAAACLLAALWGMTGIWVAFPVVELGTTAAGMLCLRPRNSTAIRKNSQQLL